MKKLLYFLYILVIPSGVYSQMTKYPVAMPSPGVLAYGDKPSGFAFLSNVAALAHYEKNEITVFSERRFMLEELQFFSASAAFKIGGGKAAFVMEYQGFEGYKFMHAGMAYARDLGRIALGLKFNYFSERAGPSTAAKALSAETGMTVSLTPKLKFGWQLSNYPSSARKEAGKMPAMYKAGLGFMASGECLVGLEIMKEENFPVNIHAGFAYTYRRRFFIRGGTQSATGSYYAGGGWAMKNFQLHLSVSHHPYLGFSPGLLLSNKF